MRYRCSWSRSTAGESPLSLSLSVIGSTVRTSDDSWTRRRFEIGLRLPRSGTGWICSNNERCWRWVAKCIDGSSILVDEDVDRRRRLRTKIKHDVLAAEALKKRMRETAAIADLTPPVTTSPSSTPSLVFTNNGTSPSLHVSIDSIHSSLILQPISPVIKNSPPPISIAWMATSLYEKTLRSANITRCSIARWLFLLLPKPSKSMKSAWKFYFASLEVGLLIAGLTFELFLLLSGNRSKQEENSAWYGKRRSHRGDWEWVCFSLRSRTI